MMLSFHIFHNFHFCSWPKVVASKCTWNKLTAFSKMRHWGSSTQIHRVINISDQNSKPGELSSLQTETFSFLDQISNFRSSIRCLRMRMNSPYRVLSQRYKGDESSKPRSQNCNPPCSSLMKFLASLFLNTWPWNLKIPFQI